MTQQYLGGELSLLLGQLQAFVTSAPLVSEVAHLRHRAEAGQRSALTSACLDALHLADRVCWVSLTEGDLVGFANQASVCAQLWEFGLCSGLIVSEE